MPGKLGQVRIIAGHLRGRKLFVESSSGLRPTQDKTRETLFNWLMHDIAGSCCLDVFAGSGALGFEAYSRGAKSVVMLEVADKLYRRLIEQCHQFDADDCIQVYHANASDVVTAAKQVYDIVFLDPPFASDLLEKSCAWLNQPDWLASGALVYIETHQREAELSIPNNWKILKAKQQGQACYYLCQVHF